MKLRCFLFFFAAVLLESQVVFSQPPKKIKWDMDNLDGWEYEHQDDNPDTQCSVEKGILRIFTRANSLDRKKIRTIDKVFTTGRYTWRTYISDVGIGDMTSIGSWIYADDHHEIDFEVGYGRKAVRDRLGVNPNELIAYMTSQDFPYKSVRTPVKVGWHIFELDIILVNSNYKINWLIDKKIVNSLQLTYGEEVPFRIYCSVENLNFIGDKPASKDNYGLFDYVKYTYHK